MTASVRSIALSGLNCVMVDVQADLSAHLPTFTLVGLPDAAVQEARERIRSAFENSGLSFPRQRIVVNLAPANVRKEGSFFDVPIAVSIIAAQYEATDIGADTAFIGELSLDGSIRSVRGVLLAVAAAKDAGIKRIFVPSANAREASYVRGIDVYPVERLNDFLPLVSQGRLSDPLPQRDVPMGIIFEGVSAWEHVRGQATAKRALEIAAAGGHNVLLSGPPGSGKTMLARSMHAILPPLTEQEVLEVSRLYSYAGLTTSEQPLVLTRPFRSPHHTASTSAIVGGGTIPRPGEVTLAHRGILFLDEFPEFQRQVLEALRQPLEDKVVTVSRVASTVQFPAHVTLVAAQNPCPCGHWGDPEHTCRCSERERRAYWKKVSGPLLDRIDLVVRVQPVPRVSLMSDTAETESSRVVRERVMRARGIQHARSGLNGDLDHASIKRTCVLSDSTKSVLLSAADTLGLSARSFTKVLRVARTIADLSSETSIAEEHILEALHYRQLPW